MSVNNFSDPDTNSRADGQATVSFFSALLNTAPTAHRVTALASELELPQTAEAKGNDCPGWSPAEFSGSRKRDNVARVHFLVFDFDASEPDWSRFTDLDYVAHTTHSHAADAPRWRLILSLSRPVLASDWGRHLFEAFELSDRSWEGAKDCSRFFYLPPEGCEIRRQAGVAWEPAAKPQPALRRALPPRLRSIAGGASSSAWARKALQSACNQIRSANAGMRHEAVIAGATAMGEIVAGGSLSESTVKDELATAARDAFGSEWERREAETFRTIRDGLAKGSNNPRGPSAAIALREAHGADRLGRTTSTERVDSDEADTENWPHAEAVPPPVTGTRIPHAAQRFEHLQSSISAHEARAVLLTSGHKSLDDFSIARHVVEVMARAGRPLLWPAGQRTVDPVFYVYTERSGTWREVDGAALAADACGQLHGCVTDGALYSNKDLADQNAKEAVLERYRFRATIQDKKAVAAQMTDHLRARQEADGLTSDPFEGAPPGATFTNGAIVIRDGIAHWERPSPDHMRRFSYGFEFRHGLTPRYTQQVMRDWFRDCDATERDARIDALREVGGIAILGAYGLVKRGAWLYGQSGRDGKSTFIELLRGLLPPGSHCSVSPSDAANSVTGKDALARLRGKLANLVDEAEGDAASIADFKSVLVCETISARRIKGESFEFTPTCAHVFASNALPTLDVDTPWMRRILPIAFNAPIPAHLVDRELVAKLLGHEAREIVCWFVEAALDMLALGQRSSCVVPGPEAMRDRPRWLELWENPPAVTYTEPACVAQVFAEWRGSSSSDLVGDFLDTLPAMGTPTKPQAEWPKTADLYERFRIWFDKNGYKASALPCSRVFGKQLSRIVTTSSRALRVVKRDGACACFAPS